MYKVFFNQKCLILNSSSLSKGDASVVLNKVPKNFKKWIKDHLINTKIQTLVVESENHDKLWKSLCAEHKLVTAAGGLVVSEGKYLFIKRLGLWDLPKGKLEKGEDIETCAIREVQEECGLKTVQIIQKLVTTYHVYEHKGKDVLKDTHWYLMKGDSDEMTTPQLEENIEAVKWFDQRKLKKPLAKTYPSIVAVLTVADLI